MSPILEWISLLWPAKVVRRTTVVLPHADSEATTRVYLNPSKLGVFWRQNKATRHHRSDFAAAFSPYRPLNESRYTLAVHTYYIPAPGATAAFQSPSSRTEVDLPLSVTSLREADPGIATTDRQTHTQQHII
jgi:hypothetical protein